MKIGSGVWLTNADHPGNMAPLEIVCEMQRAGFLLNSRSMAQTAHQTNHQGHVQKNQCQSMSFSIASCWSDAISFWVLDCIAELIATRRMTPRLAQITLRARHLYFSLQTERGMPEFILKVWQ